MVTSVEPVVNASGRYTISETCNILGIHRHTLRQYVKSGLIRPIFKRRPPKAGATRQRFLGSEIVRFWRAFV